MLAGIWPVKHVIGIKVAFLRMTLISEFVATRVGSSNAPVNDFLLPFKMEIETMLRLTYAASSIFLVAVFVLVQSGCREKTSKWDTVQEATEGKTAKESSQERLDSKVDLPPSYKGLPVEDDEELGAMPAYNPEGGTTDDSAAILWQPKELQTEPPASLKIDIDSLRSGEPLPGSDLNKFFPVQSVAYDTVAKQEKTGFAQYSLRRDGSEIGQLSITDLRGNPAAAEKFKTPDMTIATYPAKKDGSKGTTLLVAGRFQLKVRSPDGQLNEKDRVTWLQKFDMVGIALLAN